MGKSSVPIVPQEIPDALTLTPIERVQIDLQVSTAKAYPRDIEKAAAEAMLCALEDPESMHYSLGRAGNEIEGPSVRLAEIVAMSWGNLRTESRVLGHDGKHVSGDATVWDMERNILHRAQVKRRITNKSGQTYNDDMITVTGNAAASIAYRNAIFKVIPASFIRRIYRACLKESGGTENGKGDNLRSAVEWFAEKGVEEAAILTLLKRSRRSDITTDDIRTLRGLAQAIKEGSTTIEETFNLRAAGATRVRFGAKDKPPAKEGKPLFGDGDTLGDDADIERNFPAL